MKCEEARNDFWLYLYGELELDGEEAVESHLAECAGCREALERERKLHAALDVAREEPPAGLLASCRRELAAAIERPRAWWMGFGWLKPAVAAVALVAIGYFAGHAPRESEILATRVKNVEPDGTGRVRIVLEETRQRTVDGAMNEGGIRKLLLAAARDPADAGLRVDSMELLRRDTAAAEVRQALAAALETDSNPGVRLKALEALKPYANDPAVRRSLARALLADDNAGVRTQAVDLLVQSKDKDMAGVLQQSMQQEPNDYIRSRTRNALRAMNASVDAF